MAYELVGVLGIQSSPSCDPSRGRSVFMEKLTDIFAKNEICLETFWYLPNSSNPKFRNELHHL